MFFDDTHLPWVPTSPYIPEADSPIFYATTGIIGALSVVSIGIGYTLPFKIVGAPWVNGENFARALNKQNLPGVKFVPFYFRPQFGLFASKPCEGVLITITDKKLFRPLTVQYLLLGVLKSMYPKQVGEALNKLDSVRKNHFCKACGNEDMLDLLIKEKYIAWKLIQFEKTERELFLAKRKKYLLY